MVEPDIELLRKFAWEGDEASFAQLVHRHVRLVYSTALRHLGGDSHSAEDVSQQVFTDLAQKAKSLLRQRTLAGWLFRHTFFTASKHVRSEQRRLERERQSCMAEDLSLREQSVDKDLLPLLDATISSLRQHERDAVVLRFFNGLDFANVASVLGISETAAQKRVERALHKLRTSLRAQGVTLSSTAVASILLGAGWVATPPGFAATIAAASLAGATANTASVLTLASGITMTKLKFTVCALLLAAFTTPVLIQHRALTTLRAENQALRLNVQTLEKDNGQDLVGKYRVDPAELDGLRHEHSELMRLRGDANVRQHQIEELKAQLAMAAKRSASPEPGEPKAPGGRYYAAEQWTNLGFREPQNAAVSFFWALRSKDQDAYEGALGKPMPAVAGDWAKAFENLKGSFISTPEALTNGDVKISAVHESASGETLNTFITYRQENGRWLIRELAGFPIELRVEAAKYSVPAGK